MDRVLTSQAYTVYCRQRCSPSCLQELGWGWVGLVGGQQRTGVCLDLVGPARRTSTVSLANALFVSEEPPPSLGPVRRTGRSGLWASPCCLFIYLSDLWITEEKCLRMFRQRRELSPRALRQEGHDFEGGSRWGFSGVPPSTKNMHVRPSGKTFPSSSAIGWVFFSILSIEVHTLMNESCIWGIVWISYSTLTPNVNERYGV